MARDKLLYARLSSKNSGVVNATEAASTNPVTVPPGEYDVEVVCGAITGTSPTCAIDIKESSDGSTFTSLVDARTRSLDNTLTVSQRFFLRGVRIVKWANGAAGGNAGVTLTVGGTSPVFTGVEIYFHPRGRAPGYNGTP